MHVPRLISFLLCLALLSTGLWAGENAPASPKSAPEGSGSPKAVKQSFCPPCEMKLDPKANLYVDVEGYRIYICSSYCGEKVKKNPAVYIKKIQDAGETPEVMPAKQAFRAGSAHDKYSIKSCCVHSGNSPETAKK